LKVEVVDTSWDFVFPVEIAPAKTMITKDLTEPVMDSGVLMALEGRTSNFLWTI
jgi:hypothetical protein